MSNEIDYFWESLLSPGRTKWETKKDKSGSKRKNDIPLNSNGIILKKKQPKKEKKKKKKKKPDLNSIFGSGDAAVTTESKSVTSHPRSSGTIRKEKSHRTIQDTKKKGQRKKKVAFDLSRDSACVPNFASIRPKFPKECPEFKKAAETDCERATFVSEIAQHQSQLQDNNIQWEESNSQDLFITQKIFRSSSSDTSGEDSYKAATTTSPQQTQILDKYLDQIKYLDKDSCQLSRKKKRQKTGKKTRTAEKNRSHSRKKNDSFQNKSASPIGAEAPLCSLYSKPNVMNLHMDKMAVADRSPPKVTKKRALHIPLKPTACTATQTENFFTAELSSYFAFSTKRRLAGGYDVENPLDLSLPQRARKDPWRWASSEVKENEKWGENKLPARGLNVPSSCCSAMKDLEVKEGVVVNEKREGETTESSLTESEPKSGDTTTSSDCNELPGQSKKVDLNQVKPVQMRLNESFFFKTKGEGHSPRPESPLMKLSQSRASEKDMKGKKTR
ncbi:uncharacterized protein si:ch211-176l24.4 [Syngnathus typhle]|uniref:uncharacterized protein si:ch211-176l24.4 n=1 Tax=Syngnathus typhle TaxID=161592 RepID=UPI002A6ADEC8|nr:uncharacterized protein si:ch211-176l24.4 [Syngnathus typhle]